MSKAWLAHASSARRARVRLPEPPAVGPLPGQFTMPTLLAKIRQESSFETGNYAIGCGVDSCKRFLTFQLGAQHHAAAIGIIGFGAVHSAGIVPDD